MNKVSDEIYGYSYGEPEVPASAITLQQLEELKESVGLTGEDEQYLRLAGQVLADQTAQVVAHWRGRIIGSIPQLARHSRTPEGDAIPEYMAKSNLRFRQWILDTCMRPYDEDWINYQEEIARRHTSEKKNQVDSVRSTPYVPLRDIIGFIAVMNETIKPYLGAKGHPAAEVDRMHSAWCKSLQLQAAIWARVYMEQTATSMEW
jgi:hypothetical protein